MPLNDGLGPQATLPRMLPGSIKHAELGAVLPDQHHPKSHGHNGDGSGNVAHGSLTGLATGDDHTQYQKESEKDAASGYAGLSAASRTTKGVDTQDDLVIDLATKGLVLKDTQATPHYWRLTIDNLGALVITDLGTTKP